MPPKPNRLPASEIRSVLRSKNRVRSPEFQLVFQKIQEREVNFATTKYSRFAVVVPNEIDKRATARNRMKRLIRESIRHLTPRIVPCIDCVVFARSNLADRSQKEVETLLADVCTQSHLFNH